MKAESLVKQSSLFFIWRLYFAFWQIWNVPVNYGRIMGSMIDNGMPALKNRQIYERQMITWKHITVSLYLIRRKIRYYFVKELKTHTKDY